MVGFADWLATGQSVGLFEFYLPFVLSFAILYGILRKAKIFGDNRTGKTTDLIVSLVLSVFVIGYTPVGVSLATFFGTMFTGTVTLIVTLLGTIMILYVLGKVVGIEITGKQADKRWGAALVALTLLIAAAAFVSAGGLSIFGTSLPSVGSPSFSLPALPSVNISAEDVVIFGGVALVIAAMIWMATEKENKGK